MKSSFIYCIPLYNYQTVSLLLFFIGMVGIIYSKNFIKILISIEFIINSINILFISFAAYRQSIDYLGYTIVIFTTGISALTVAVCLYFLNLVYKKFGTINFSKIYKNDTRGNKC